MRFSILCTSIIGVVASMSSPVYSQGMTFAIIPHSTSDENFINAKNGAESLATQNGDQILFLGKDGAGHVRNQFEALQTAIDQGVDGIGLAPMKIDQILGSDLLAAMQEAGIPLVLFESDFPEDHHDKREGFVGTNAIQMGQALGDLVKELQPEGGTIALMANTPGHASIALRMQGIRPALSGDDSFDGKLAGEGGWTEHERTPWFSEDKYDLALRQMEQSLKDDATDVFLSAGWWPQMSENYRNVVSQYQDKLAKGEKLVVSGDASEYQLGHLAMGLSNGNVSQDFFAMGEYMYESMKSLNEGASIDSVYYTPVKVHTK